MHTLMSDWRVVGNGGTWGKGNAILEGPTAPYFSWALALSAFLIEATRLWA
jgi:hypothetical protein